MEIDNPNVKINGKGKKIDIVLPYFNESIGLELLKNTKQELLKLGVKENDISTTRVSGALEIPFACKKIAERSSPDAIIALGAIIKGETSHYDLVCFHTYSGIMDVQLKSDIPIVFGILTCENEKQARDRASEDGLNKGASYAASALLQTKL